MWPVYFLADAATGCGEETQLYFYDIHKCAAKWQTERTWRWMWVLMHGAARHSASGCWSSRHGREELDGWRCFSTSAADGRLDESLLWRAGERCCRGGAGVRCQKVQVTTDGAAAARRENTLRLFNQEGPGISWPTLQNRTQWHTLILICIVTLMPIFYSYSYFYNYYYYYL